MICCKATARVSKCRKQCSRSIQELTVENLNLLIERIEVFDRTETDGETEQSIRICYRFGGYIGEHRFKAKVLRNTGGWEQRRKKERKDNGKDDF